MFPDLVQMMRFIIGQDFFFIAFRQDEMGNCLLYTSDAADD